MTRKVAAGLGLALALLAVFAQTAGLAHSAAWGSTRTLMLLAGLALIALALAPPAVRWVARQYPRAGAFFARAGAAWRAAWRSLWISAIVSALLLAGIGAYYAWFSSAGLFPTFHPDFNPYVDLGESFLRGQLALPQQPDPRLALIADPWNNIAERSQIPYKFDLSYYKGKYYLYWGPVPALVYASYELITGTRPPDQFGMLLFTVGLGALLSLILFMARRWFFPRAPAITIPIFVLAGMVNLPVVLLVMHSNVYETAIMAGQFFLFLGLAGWLAYLGTQRRGWLALAGLGYALAIGSRFNLLLCVGVFVLFALAHLYRQGRLGRESLRQAALLLAPLALMALALGWYNYARFGSPLQMGYVYQLPKPGQTYQDVYAHAYSAGYVGANLYYYLLYPPTIQRSFPYIHSVLLPVAQVPGWVTLSPLKRQDQIMYGAAFVLPVFWLLALVAPAALPRRTRANPQPAPGRSAGASFLGMCFLGGLVEFLFLMVFYFAGERFILDFSVLWIAALALGAWFLDERLAGLPRGLGLGLRSAFWLAALLLALATALIGFLSGFDLTPQPFRVYNPAAFDAIGSRFDLLLGELERFYQGPSLAAALLRWVTRFQ